MSIVSRSTQQYSGFNPRTIPGCALWLDAADVNGNGTNPANGAAVNTWTDKSGNGRNATPQSTNPTYANNGVVFAANSLLNTGLPYSSLFTMTYFAVGTYTGSTAQDIISVASIPTTAKSGWQVLIFNGIQRVSTYDGTLVNLGSAIDPSTPFLINGTASSAATSTLYYNGRLTSTATAPTLNGSGTLTIGGYRDSGINGNQFYNGNLHEIIVFNTVLTTAQRQAVEGYLAWKWGLQNYFPAGPRKLPVSHPYFTIPVTTRIFQPTDIEGCTLWLDAADRSTMTFSGSNVTEWRDKSGNGFNAVSNGTNTTATYTTTINGRDVVSFPTLSQMNITSMTIPNQAKSVFYVVRPNGTLTSASTNNRFVMPINCLSTNGLQSFFSGGTSASPPYNFNLISRTGVLDHRNFSTDFSIASIFFMVSAVVGTNIADNVGLYNGSSSGLTLGANNAATGFLTSAATYTIGNAIYTTPWDLAEMIIYNSNVSVSQRQQIEGYLASKWGLSGSLPSTQPYFLQRALPSTPVFTPTSLSGLQLWLDAADVNGNGTNPANGAAVNTWADKSGNGFNGNLFTGTAASPTYNSSSRSIVFNGSNGFSTSYSASSNIETGFVITNVTNGTPANTLLGVGNRSGARQFRISGRQIQTINQNVAVVLASGGTVPNATDILCEYVNNGSQLNHYLNGFLYAGPATSVTYTAGGTTSIGRNTNPEALIGSISEIIVFNTALTTAQRQAVEGYLAWKWGLQNYFPAGPRNLPVSHPYFTIPVTTRIFQPTDIEGCALWLDAADGSTISFSSGTNVSQWRDKSQSNITLSTIGSPIFSSNSINFTGTQYFSNSSISLNLASITVFLVGYNSTSGGFLSLVPIANGTDFNQSNAITYNYSTTPGQLFITHNFTVTSFNQSFISSTNPILFSHTQNGTATTLHNAGTIFLNSNISVTPGITTGLSIGARFQNGNGTVSSFLSGKINEIIVFNTALTTAQRQQVEGYLASKWGLSGSLPTTQPYFLQRALPSTPVFTPTSLSGLQLWLDAADVNGDGTVPANGATVNTWRDKSGRGRNVTQTTAGIIPTYSSVRNSIVFTGTQFLTIPDALNSITPVYTIFVVDKRATSSAAFFIGGNTLSTGNAGLILGYNDSTTFRHTTAHIADLDSTITVYNPTAEPTRLWTLSYSGSIRSTHGYGSLLSTQSFSTTLPSWNVASIGIGFQNLPYRGDIYEIIFFNTVLTTAQRQAVEGYLAWKWNLYTSLPTTHPYKKFRA